MKKLKLGTTIFGMALLCTLLSLHACRSVGQTPEDIANAFVTAYYIDADLDQALHYCDGLACQKLRNGLQLRDGQKITADTFQPKITAKRKQVIAEAGDVKRYVYTLTVQPKEIEPFEREAYVKLRKDGSGAWKVSQFAEIQTTPEPGL